jgi:hypothetical protein
MKENNYTHGILHTMVWQKKKDFSFKSILLYNPQKDKTLSTSKKEDGCKQGKVDSSLFLVKNNYM